jgi:hypothetical protein
MASLEQIYAPVEVKTLLEPGELVRYSLTFTQGKRNWTGLHYEIAHGLWYVAHLSNQRLILESNVTSAQNAFLQKALAVGFSLVAWRLRAPRPITKLGGKYFNQVRQTEQAASAAGDEALSIPYASLSRAEKSTAWVRLVLSNPPPGFDPHSLVFMAAPPPGRRVWRSGWTTAADAVELINRMLRECPSEAVIVS